MKKYMLLNMLIIFGVMQTGDLFCMNKFVTNVFKPVNMRQLTKSKFCNYRYRIDPEVELLLKRFSDRYYNTKVVLSNPKVVVPIVTTLACLVCNAYYHKKSDMSKKRDTSTENEIGQIEMKEWLCNLRNADKKRDIHILLNQQKLINYLNSNIQAGPTWDQINFTWKLSGIISKSVNDNNQLKLVLMSGYLPVTRCALVRFIDTTDHEDPEMMAKLLIGWKNNNKVFESLCDNDGKISDCSNKIGCKIFEEEIDRIRRKKHDKYIKLLRNKPKN